MNSQHRTSYDNKVVVGIDDSENAATAARWAAAEALRRGTGLVLLHSRRLDGRAMAAMAAPSTVVGEPTVYGAALLSELAANLVEEFDGLDVKTVLTGDDLPSDGPADALIEAADTAQLVVVGSHGSGRILSVVLGSVSARVAAHASSDVAVINSPASVRAAGPVVVGVSSTDGGMRALGVAFAQAQALHTDLVVVRSWAHTEWSSPSLGFSGVLFEEWHALDSEMANGCVDLFRGHFPDITVTVTLSHRDPVDALLQASRDAALLVVGCRRGDHHRLSRLGPVSGALLHRASCPILVSGQRHSFPSRGGTQVGSVREPAPIG